MIESHAELVHVFDLLFDGDQVLQGGIRRRERHMLEESHGQRVESLSGDPIVCKGRADAGCGCRQRIADRSAG
jgi:hypothetical protein